MKVPCSRCGNSILPTTSAKNAGLCMPCATGTRESLETGKEQYKRQREIDTTDPVRILWLSLVERVEHAGSGFLSLSIAERRYFAVGLLNLEVYNGGFDQYFFNSSSDYYNDAVLGLEEMGATASVDLLLRAKRVVFGLRDVPTETAKRREISRALLSSQANELHQLDQLFWQDPDCLDIRIETFLHRHGLMSDVA